MSMITATAWVPRGRAAAFPTKYIFDEEEYARIAKLAKIELEEARNDLEEARQTLSHDSNGTAAATSATARPEEAGHAARNAGDNGFLEDDELKEYDMEHYDDEPADSDGQMDHGEPTNNIIGNIKGLAYYKDDQDDPYLDLPGHGEESDEEERDELQILPTDNLVLAARIEDEVAHLETYVYEDEAANLYVHHDVMLPAVPLCVEWVAVKPGTVADQGNLAAVGTMDPDIEIWDLDVVDGMYPTAVLGQASPLGAEPLSEPTTTKSKRRKTRKPNDTYHVDAVLSLAANRQKVNLLASASADNTIKLWDLHTCTAAQSYSHHNDKVCTLSWHPTQAAVLLSGSYDRTVVAADMRAPRSVVPRWGVESDVEQVQWDPHNENYFYVSTENGILHCFDARELPRSPEYTKPLWRLQAHEKSLSSFSLNTTIPGYIATASTDRTVKLWNVAPQGQNESMLGPSIIVSRDLDVGKVFSVRFAPDAEISFRLAVAGSKGSVQVWDTSTNRAVREAFAGRVKIEEVAEEKLVGIEMDDEEAEEEAEAEAVEDGGWESMEED